MVDAQLMRPPGELPVPAVLVLHELATGHRTVVDETAPQGNWSDDLAANDVLVLCLDAEEVAGYALAAGKRRPLNVIDLGVEAQALSNGLAPSFPTDLVLALVRCGVPRAQLVESLGVKAILASDHLGSVDRERVTRHASRRLDILNDTRTAIQGHFDLQHALLRGRYLVNLADVGRQGVPVDEPTIRAMNQYRGALLQAAIATAPRAPDGQGYFVTEGDRVHFRTSALARYFGDDGDWPADEDGNLLLDHDTLRLMEEIHPELRGLDDAKSKVEGLQYRSLAVDSDRRHRFEQRPFASRTGRNQPLGREALLVQARWRRLLVVARPGHVLICADFSSQELGIAAALSGDGRLKAVYEAKDSYIGLGQELGRIPAGATKDTHPRERAVFKTVGLAVQYGGGPSMIAALTGLDRQNSLELLELHRRTFGRFWAWREAAVNEALLTNRLTTMFGWPLHVEPGYNVRSLANFPVQANAAEILRLSVIALRDAGFDVCATVHDCCVVEVAAEDAEAAAEEVKRLMVMAGEVVLGGFRLRIDVDLVRPGQRWRQKSSSHIWEWLVEQLQVLGVRVENP